MLKLLFTKRLILFRLCLLSLIPLANAQETDPVKFSKFSMFIEGGSSLFLNATSVNAEYTFFTNQNENLRLNARLGAGTGYVFWGPSGLGGLAGVTLLTGKKSHHLELNVGAYILNETYRAYEGGVRFENEYFWIPNFNVGYRFQPAKGGLLFKVNAGLPGFGLGLGYAF